MQPEYIETNALLALGHWRLVMRGDTPVVFKRKKLKAGGYEYETMTLEQMQADKAGFKYWPEFSQSADDFVKWNEAVREAKVCQ